MLNEHDLRDFGIDDYQEQAAKYRVPTSPPEERVLGFLEECGEFAGVFKRLLRGDYPQDVAATKAMKELGDALWYLSQIALDNGVKLSEIARENLEKLESRQIRGKILGTGDDR